MRLGADPITGILRHKIGTLLVGMVEEHFHVACINCVHLWPHSITWKSEWFWNIHLENQVQHGSSFCFIQMSGS